MRKAFRWLWAKKWKRLAPVLLVVFVVGSIAMVETTSTSSFCNSCHIMGPYYDSWKTSAHKDVECVKCHIDPGVDSFVAAKLNGLGQVVDDVLHRTSTKPSASVNELSCTRSGCHSVETLKSKATINDKFKFRHDKHLGTKHLGVEITCSACHSHVKGDEHFEVNTTVCITCHMVQTAETEVGAGGSESRGMFSVIRMAVRDPRLVIASDEAPRGGTTETTSPETLNSGEPAPPTSCKTCHEPPSKIVQYQGLEVNHEEFLSFGASCESCHRNTTATPDPIEDGRCLQCHNFGIERATDAHDMHKIHSLGEHKVECFNCHGAIEHGPEAQVMSIEQFDCRQCHINQHAVQRREYLLAGQPEGPMQSQAVNPMFLAHVDCTGCHIKVRTLHANPLSGAKVTAASPEACDRCHYAGFGEKMVPLWQNATRKLFGDAEKSLEEVEAIAQSDQAIALVGEARELINIVRVDGSWGVHNPKYTQALLEEAQRLLSEARQASEPAP